MLFDGPDVFDKLNEAMKLTTNYRIKLIFFTINVSARFFLNKQHTPCERTNNHKQQLQQAHQVKVEIITVNKTK